MGENVEWRYGGAENTMLASLTAFCAVICLALSCLDNYISK